MGFPLISFTHTQTAASPKNKPTPEQSQHHKLHKCTGERGRKNPFLLLAASYCLRFIDFDNNGILTSQLKACWCVLDCLRFPHIEPHNVQKWKKDLRNYVLCTLPFFRLVFRFRFSDLSFESWFQIAGWLVIMRCYVLTEWKQRAMEGM